MTAAVQCLGLSKQFGQRTALQSLDLTVEPGHVVGYLGPNGAGKTTTLRLISGALRPTAGAVRVFGIDGWTHARLAHEQLGILSSDPAFELRLTSRGVLAGSARARGWWPDDAEPVQLALADRFGLELDRRIGELSRGNRQKLAVVLAFWHRPSLLLLDEPTTGLDPLAQEILHDLIRQAATGGAGILLSSHVLAEVEAVAERVVVLREGRLVADRDVAELAAQAPHQLTAVLANERDAHVLDHESEVRDLRLDGRTLRCSVPRRSLDAVIKALASVEVGDVRIHEADLEDWFRGLYLGDSGSMPVEVTS